MVKLNKNLLESVVKETDSFNLLRNFCSTFAQFTFCICQFISSFLSSFLVFSSSSLVDFRSPFAIFSLCSPAADFSFASFSALAIKLRCKPMLSSRCLVNRDDTLKISAHVYHKRKFLHYQGGKARLIEGRRVAAEYMSYWRRRFSVTLQNAIVKLS